MAAEPLDAIAVDPRGAGRDPGRGPVLYDFPPQAAEPDPGRATSVGNDS